MDYESWRDTLQTIHRFAQVIGKLRLAASPGHNHWWNVPLRLTGRGITTRPMGRETIFCIDFDFLDHRLDMTTTAGLRYLFSLPGLSVAAFYDRLQHGLATLGVKEEVAWPYPFDLPRPAVMPGTTLRKGAESSRGAVEFLALPYPLAACTLDGIGAKRRQQYPDEEMNAGGLMSVNDDDITTTTGSGGEGPADGGANPGGHDGGADGSADHGADGDADHGADGDADGGADDGADGGADDGGADDGADGGASDSEGTADGGVNPRGHDGGADGSA